MSEPSFAPSAPPSTLLDLLQWRVDQQGEGLAFTYMVDGDKGELQLTYSELDRQSRAIAAMLQKQIQQGERAVLLYPPGLDFIVAYFACLYAGVVAVPVYPPRPRRPSPRLQAIVKDSRATFALTTTTILANLTRRIADAPDLKALQWLVTDNSSADLNELWHPPDIGSHSLAMLQYTSGSTSAPKGVMLSHGNLIHNLSHIHQILKIGKQDIGVFWLPVYHDLGLIGGILAPVYTGCMSVLMPPVAFLQRPVLWLETIDRFGGTISGAPNFAYELCIRQISADHRAKFDLNSWRVAFSGAEPVRHDTLERFAAKFRHHGFRKEAFCPSYGLAEATLMVSSGLVHEVPVTYPARKDALDQQRIIQAKAGETDAKTLVSCGKSLKDQKIVIVHPETANRCSPGEVGEIWIQGPSVAQGYWRQPEMTQRIFQAHLSDTDEGPFLRTEDLGFLHNGELYITGRLKDLIIVRGRNYYPQDIELTAGQSHPAFRSDYGAAFSIEVAETGEEGLVIIQEVERGYRHKLDIDEAIAAIRQAIADEFDLQVHAIVLVMPFTILRTSSGKIRRQACRAAFLDGDLKIVGQWQAKAPLHHDLDKAPQAVDRLSNKPAMAQAASVKQAEIKAWLINRIAVQLNIEPDEIDVYQPFTCYGLDSVQATVLATGLSDRLGYDVSPMLAYEYPTIAAVAEHLVGQPSASSNAARRSTLAKQQENDAIAIIGIGCRFPLASGPQAFWELLKNGIDAITEVPEDRWNLDELYDPDAATPGKMHTRWGGFLSQVDCFDPHFFGISPREVTSMDPQQRLLLEVAWEALEDAGLVSDELVNTRTGVFIGISSNDYGRRQLDDVQLSDPHMGTGNALSIAANRLSYVFGFRGPSMAVDTACSSSLVAVHLAYRSLQSGESTIAIAGGANLILSPDTTVNFSKAGFMAPDGRCKAFDARANGYVRGEGVGLVVLKPLSQALADGDPIYAIIRGSAVNQDGRSNGLTAPSPKAQENLLREAYRQANISPGQVQYIEAHGTGTALGDPIECKALERVMATNRPPGSYCAIGSVKTNIGHLEAAAGIAGLIKVALSLERRSIPPSLHFHVPNPLIPFEDLSLRVQQTLTKWPRTPAPRVAGVSSFGFGGTNAHVVLEEAPRPVIEQSIEETGLSRTELLPISARSHEALLDFAHIHSTFLTKPYPLSDICFTAGVRRSHHDNRLAVIGRTREEISKRLLNFANSGSTVDIAIGRRPNQSPKIVFVFSGQGSQWPRMGQELLAQEHTFRAALKRCESIIRELGDWSLLHELSLDETQSRLYEVDVAQPALFAIQVGLAALWLSWGIEPVAVVGHSTGEVAAAYMAGALSLEDAFQIVCGRSQLFKKVSGKGRMAVVELPAAQAEQALVGYEDSLTVAVYNSPSSVVISGDPIALEEITDSFQRRNIPCHFVNVDIAYHSPHVASLGHELRRMLDGLQAHPTTIPFYSTVTGQVELGTDLGVEHWIQNLKKPVRFSAAISQLAEDHDIFLEISPHPLVVNAIQQVMQQMTKEGTALPSLKKKQDERTSMLRSLGVLYALGCPVTWRSLSTGHHNHVSLPSYPWRRKRYWLNRVEKHVSKGRQQVQFTGEESTATLTQPPASAGIPYPDELSDWLYELKWLPSERTTQRPLTTYSSSDWLIFADAGGVGQNLAQLLEARKQQCFLVYAGQTPKQLAEKSFRIRHDRLDDLQQLIDSILTKYQMNRLTIVHLWVLDGPATDDLSTATLEMTQELACGSSLHLIQALTNVTPLPESRLWLVTRGAQSVPDSVSPAIAQAPLWGFGRVIAAENPDLWGGLVDLDPQAPAKATAMQLLEEIWNSDGEDQVAFRQQQRYVARITHSRKPKQQPFSLQCRADGSYLITGGLGDLGLQVARWLVFRGARRFILMGRSQLPPRLQWAKVKDGERWYRQITAILALEAMGASVHLAAVDVADEAQLAAYLKRFNDESWSPIRGVIHAAGLLQDRLLLQLEDSNLFDVLRPKVTGSWLLHHLLQDFPLDFFILFSSISSLLAQPGQGGYAAGNAFLDALAHYRHARGQPALTVNWGLWAGLGIAESPSGKRLTEWLASFGVECIPPEKALLLLEQLLGMESIQVGVMPINWRQWRMFLPAVSQQKLLAHVILRETGKRISSSEAGAESALTRDALLGAKPEKQRPLLQGYLRQESARTLGLLASEIDLEQPLTNLGIDSLMATELRNRVENDLGVSVTLADVLQGMSVATMADSILAQVTSENWQPIPELTRQAQAKPYQDDADTDTDVELSGSEAEHLLANLDELTDRQVDLLLKNLLNKKAS